MIVGVLALSGCSVGGYPQAAERDLSDRAVAAADFPGPAATLVPEQAIGYALSDLTADPIAGHETHTFEPQACAGPEITPDGAVIQQSITDDGRTLTAAVLHAPEALDDYATRVTDCPQVTLIAAAGATTVIEARLVPPPSVADQIDTQAVRRDIEIGDGMDTTALSLIAQRADVRVIVELRGPVDDPDATAAADELFRKAVGAAFS